MHRLAWVGIVTGMTLGSAHAADGAWSKDAQIAAAIQAAPEDRRDGARVLGFDGEGKVFVAREGSNDLVCLGPNPMRKKGFQVACYHRDLEPFMARGRELKAKGIVGEENRARRYAEIKAGTLAYPKGPRTLHVLSGSSYDRTKASVTDPYRRWVVYIPFATPESTGLTTQPSDRAPWLMFPGTAGAHIMITPPTQ